MLWSNICTLAHLPCGSSGKSNATNKLMHESPCLYGDVDRFWRSHDMGGLKHCVTARMVQGRSPTFQIQLVFQAPTKAKGAWQQ